MWVLSCSCDTGTKTIYLTSAKGSQTVGRSSSDLCLEGDSSISRRHCTIHCADKNSCPGSVTTRTGLWVIDLGSKYGTFYQGPEKTWSKMEPNKPYLLPSGFLLRIGILQHLFTVEYRPLYVTASKLAVADKEALQKKFRSIGGDFMNGCDNRVSYLIVDAISLTVKVLQAMTLGIPIVNPSFVSQLLNSIAENKRLPDPRQFQPIISEAALRTTDVNLNPGQKRTSLFSGLRFYTFSTGLLKNFQTVVEAAGGTLSILNYDEKTVLLKEGAVMLEDSAACSPLSSEGSSQEVSQRLLSIRDFLERHGKRTVPDREIPFAIAYSSIQRMCNADLKEFNRLAEKPVISYSQSTLIEDRTQPPMQLIEGNFPVQRIEASQYTESQLSSIASVSQQPQKVPEIASSAETMLSRKRLSSGVSMEEPVRKKPAAIEGSRLLVSKILVPESIPEEEEMPKEHRIGGFIAESPSQKTVRSQPVEAVDDMFAPQPSLLSQRSLLCEPDDDNPFGKRKASSQKSLPESAKKQKVSPLKSSFTQPQTPKTVEIKKTSPANIGDPKPSTSKDPEFEFTKPRPSKLPPVSRPTSARFDPNVCDAEGWIDTTVCKTEGDAEMGDALGNTIILLSLVTLAHARKNASSASATSAVENTGLRNVKVFRKQSFAGVNETIELDGSGTEFAEPDWSRMSR